MDLNEAMVKEIARQLGLRDNAGISAETIQRLQGRSDDELEREILNIREQLAARGVPHAKQAAMLRSLLPMMDSTQKARLHRVIGLIER